MKKHIPILLILLILPCFGFTFIAGQPPASGGCSSEPEIGLTTVGSNGGSVASGNIFMKMYSAASSGDLLAAYAYHRGTSSENCKICVYLDDGDSTPDSGDTLVACSGTIASSTDAEWATNDFASGAITSGNDYWIVLAAGTLWSDYYNTVAGGYYPSVAQDFYTSAPATLEVSGFTWNALGREHSVYITVCVP